MSRATNRIGAGMKAVGTGLKMVGGGDVPAYTIEFLTGSEKHPVNSNQTIVAPYVELGRDSECAVSFGNDLPMVSRKHAAIERRGPEIFIKQLSQTNQTLINGRPVENEWYLNNGDEIQLSASGPRLRYLATAAKPATMGMSRRIQLFAKQTLRPYRRALITLLVLFVVGVVAAAYLITNLRSDNRKLQQAYAQIGQQTEQQETARQRGDSLFLAQQKEIAEKLAAANQEKDQLKAELAGLKNSVQSLKKTPPAGPPKDVVPVATTKETPAKESVLPQLIEDVRKHVYFLNMYLTVEGEFEKTYVGSGTAFLLSDGRFVTARHCVQPWAFARIKSDKPTNDFWLKINWLYYNRPKGTVKMHLELISPENKLYQLPGEKFVVQDTKDLYYADIDVSYGPGKLQLASIENGTDWAYHAINADKLSGIPFDPAAAASLKSGTVLHVLGYTFGLTNGDQAPSPFYSTANVSQNGLVKGLINVTNLGFAEGNSGGPAFVEKNGQLVNVGLISAGNTVLGAVVPISALNEAAKQ